MKRKPNQTRVFYAKAVYGKEEIAAVNKVLKNPLKIGPGESVKAFEKKIAKTFGKEHGIMVNSGSSANLLALEALELPKGSEVITPTLTFSTTVTPLIQKGLTPVFVDVEEGTYLANLDQIEKAITKKTSAIMLPSLIGNIPDLQKLRGLARKHKLKFIEDSADTLGATFAGKPTGFYSDASTTSFYASHIITAAGGGGMLCLRDDVSAERARVIAAWGRRSTLFGVNEKSEDIDKRFTGAVDGVTYDAKFIFAEQGYNFQSTELQAAFGLEQLKRLTEFTKRRQKRFAELQKFFKNYEHFFILPKQDKRVKTNWLAFPLTIRTGAPFTRIEITKYLEKHNIQTRPIFTGNILRQPAFSKIKHKKAVRSFPVADHIMGHSFLLGAHHGMTDGEMAHMLKTVRTFLKQY